MSFSACYDHTSPFYFYFVKLSVYYLTSGIFISLNKTAAMVSLLLLEFQNHPPVSFLYKIQYIFCTVRKLLGRICPVVNEFLVHVVTTLVFFFLGQNTSVLVPLLLLVNEFFGSKLYISDQLEYYKGYLTS